MWREREKGESLRIVIEKLSRIHIGLGYIYIHASGTHNTVRKEKEKGKVNNLNNYTLSNTPLKLEHICYMHQACCKCI